MTAGSWSEPWATASERAHALLGHPVAAVDLDLDARRSRRARSASALGREVVGRRVLQLAREVLRVGADAPRCDGVGDVVVGGDDHLVELARRLVLGARSVAVEAIAGEDRALDQRRRPRRRRRGGAAPSTATRVPSSRARPWTRGRGDPGALGVEARRGAPRPDEQPAPAVGVVQGEVLEARARLAGVEQRLSGAALEIVRDALVRRRRRRRSCRPAVAAGASVVAEACIGRARLRH